MAKHQEAMDRMFNNVFICLKCKSKLRSDPLKIRLKKVKCRKCGYKNFRPKHKDVKSGK